MYRLNRYQNYQNEKRVIGIYHIIEISWEVFFLNCHWDHIFLGLKLLFLIISMRHRIIHFKLFNLKNIFHWDLLLTIFYYVHWIYILIVWHTNQVNIAFLNFLFCMELKVPACLSRYIEDITEWFTFMDKAFSHWFLVRLSLKLLLLRLLFVLLTFLYRRMLKNRIPIYLIKSTTKIRTWINLLSILFVIIDYLTDNPGRFDVNIGQIYLHSFIVVF